jgi:EAL domain-containing protein (putative c-di-GMP-specific phosphodiesterase class I)
VAEQQADVLIVDDEETVRAVVSRVLTKAGFRVEAVGDAESALEVLHGKRRFDTIVTDLQMPKTNGIEFIRLIRRIDLDIPVIVLTGNPSLDSAIAVVEYGGFRYLKKPVANEVLANTVREAAAMRRLAVLKRRALELCETGSWGIGDRAGLDAHFDSALTKLWIAYQPIVKWPDRVVYGYEALVRSAEPTLNNPGLLFDAAERLGRLQELGREIRRAVAESLSPAPDDSLIFVNLHASDLCDDDLFESAAPLSEHAERIVLEITERTSLHRISDLRGRIESLRRLGFRIAVDDLGAGYAGLASFSQLEPDVAKLDMSLVRGIDASTRKSSIVRSMIAVCTRELGTSVICEGVETPAERDTLQELGADLLQGYLFAKPERQFRQGSIFAPPRPPDDQQKP